MSLYLRKAFKYAITCCIIFSILGIVYLSYLNYKLPTISELSEIRMQMPLRIFSKDLKLIAEQGDKRRIPIKLEDVPKEFIEAFIATEDRRFYQHHGVDLKGLARALVQLIYKGRKVQGGSTITMQVARNFFLSREKTFSRKLNEVLLAFKIERNLSKEQILELYLNKVFFGKRAYGIAAAAETYYGKKVNELTLAQMAMLAGLPKAPSTINPIRNPDAALKRRNFVLKKMLEYGTVTQEQYKNTIKEPITATYHEKEIELQAPYVTEQVKTELSKLFGEDIYTQGLTVITSIESKKQVYATEALQNNLLNYDRRHGYRGIIKHIDLSKHAIEHTGKETEIHKSFYAKYIDFFRENTKNLSSATKLNLALIVQTKPKLIAMLTDGNVVEVDEHSFDSIIIDGHKKRIPLTQFLNPGDIVYLSSNKEGLRSDKVQEVNQNVTNECYLLAQIPQASAAIVAIQPNTGAIQALVGGFDFSLSKFNRATQAKRQPGSAFKPFIYAAALEQGYTAASIINDAPFVFTDKSLLDVWRPRNHNRTFFGPIRLRESLAKSNNLATIRLLQSLGLAQTIEYINKFGFSNLPNNLTLALGTNSVTPLEMATAFCTFANTGYKVKPYIIEKITDNRNDVLFDINQNTTNNKDKSNSINYPKVKQRIISERAAYIMNSMLQEVIKTGTGKKAQYIGRTDLAGKTGSTDDFKDAWFVGYNPTLVAAAWVGFDTPRDLKEFGVKAALPLWSEFMQKALAGTAEVSLDQPEGIVTAKIDKKTGLLAWPGQTDYIFEIFMQELAPTKLAPEPKINHKKTKTTQKKKNKQTEVLF